MNPKKFEVTSTDFGNVEDRCTTVEENMKNITDVQNKILESLQKIELSHHRILAILGKLSKDDIPCDELFPLLDTDALKEAENKIKSDPSRYVTILRKIIRGDVVKNFDSIVGKTIIEDYNYDGVHERKSFKQYTALNDALYNAVKVDGTNERLYKEIIRHAFKTQKGRLTKRKYDEKKTKCLQNKENICSAGNTNDQKTNNE